MAKPIAHAIDAADRQYWRRPLWCVYGFACFSQVMCCMVRENSGAPHIWGYSVWQNAGGFRALGQPLKDWSERNGAVFFKNQKEALA